MNRRHLPGTSVALCPANQRKKWGNLGDVFISSRFLRLKAILPTGLLCSKLLTTQDRHAHRNHCGVFECIVGNREVHERESSIISQDTFLFAAVT